MHDVSEQRLTLPRFGERSQKLESNENSPSLDQNSNFSAILCSKNVVVSPHRKSNGCEMIKDRPLTHHTLLDNVVVNTSSLSFNSVRSSLNADKRLCAGGINSKSETNLCEDVILTVGSIVGVKDTLLSCDDVCPEANIDQNPSVQHSVNEQDIVLRNGSSARGTDPLQDCSLKKVVNLIPKQELKSVTNDLETSLLSRPSYSIQESTELGDDFPFVNSEKLSFSPQLSFTADYSPHFGNKQFHSESCSSVGISFSSSLGLASYAQLPPKRREHSELESEIIERIFEKCSRMQQSNGITSLFHPRSSLSTSFSRQDGRHVSFAPSDIVTDLCSDHKFIEMSSFNDNVTVFDHSDPATLPPTAPGTYLCPSTPALAHLHLHNPACHPPHHQPASPPVALDDDLNPPEYVSPCVSIKCDAEVNVNLDKVVEGAHLSTSILPHTSEVVHKTGLNQAELQQRFQKKMVTSSVDVKSSVLHKREVSKGLTRPSTEIHEFEDDDLLSLTSLIEIDDDDAASNNFLLSSDNSVVSIASSHSEHCDEDVDIIIPMKIDDALPELKVVNTHPRTVNLSPFRTSNALPEFEVGTIPLQTDSFSSVIRSDTPSQLEVENIPSKNYLGPFNVSNTRSELQIENNCMKAEDLSSFQGRDTPSELEVEDKHIKTDDGDSFQWSDTLQKFQVEISSDEQVLPYEKKEIEDGVFCNKSGSLLESENVRVIAAESVSVIRKVGVALTQNDAEVNSVFKIQNIGCFPPNPWTGDVEEKGISEEVEYPLTSHLSDCHLEPLELCNICGTLGSDKDVNMNLLPVIGNDKSGISLSSLKCRNDDPCCAYNKERNGFDSQIYCRSELPVPTNLFNLYLNPPENVSPCVSMKCDAGVNVNLDQVVGGGNGELICSTSGCRNTSPLPTINFINRREKSRAWSHTSKYKRKPCSMGKKRRLSTNFSEVKSRLNNRKGKSRSRKNCAEKRVRSVLSNFGDTCLNDGAQDKSIRSVSNCTSSINLASQNEIEENRVSPICLVVPVEEASTSSRERTAISAKDFRKIVHEYLTKFHSSPWLHKSSLPQPRCTNSTSYEDYHGDGKSSKGSSAVEDDAKMCDVSKRRLTIPKIRKKSQKLKSDENSFVLHQNSNDVSRLCLNNCVISLKKKSNGCEEIKDRPLTQLALSNNIVGKDTSSLPFSSVCSSWNVDKKCCTGGINSKSEINLCEDRSLTVESNVSVKDTSLLSCVGVCSEGNVDQEPCVQLSGNIQDIDLRNGSSALESGQLKDCSLKKIVNLVPLKSMTNEQESPPPSQPSCSIQESAKLGDDSPSVNSEGDSSLKLLLSTDCSPHFEDKQVHSDSHSTFVQLPPKRRRCSERESQTFECVSEKYSGMWQCTSFRRQNGKDMSLAPSDDIVDLISDDEFIEISSSSDDDDDVIIIDPSDHAAFAPTAPRSHLCPSSTPSFLAPPYLCKPTQHPLHHLLASSPRLALDDDAVIVEGANLSANNIPRTSEVVHKTSLNQTNQQSLPKKILTSSVDTKSSTLHKGKISKGLVIPLIEIPEVDEDELLNSTSFMKVDDDSSNSFILSSDNSVLSIASIHSEHCNEDVDIILPKKTDYLGSLYGSNASSELKVVNIPSRTDSHSPFHRSNAPPKLEVGAIISQTDVFSQFTGSSAQSQLEVENIPSKNYHGLFSASNTPSELERENNCMEVEDLSSFQENNSTSELEVKNKHMRTDGGSIQGCDTLPEFQVEISREEQVRSQALNDADVEPVFEIRNISRFSPNQWTSDMEIQGVSEEVQCSLTNHLSDSHLEPLELSNICGGSDTDVNMNLPPVIGSDKSGISRSPLKCRNDDPCANNKRINGCDSHICCRSEFPVTTNLCNLPLSPSENVNLGVSIECDAELNMNLDQIVGGGNSELTCSTSGCGNASPLPATNFINQREKCRARSLSSEYIREPRSIGRKRRSSTNFSEVKSRLSSRKRKSRTRKNCVGKGQQSLLTYFGDACLNDGVQDKSISSVSNCTSSIDLASRNEIEENRVSPICDVAPVRERERTAVVAPVIEETSTSSRPICDVAPVRERERTAVVAPVIEETSTSSRPICDVAPVRERERTAVVAPVIEETSTSSRPICDVAPVRERERTAVVAPVIEETSTSSRPICDVAPVRERERTAVVAPVIEETSTSSRPICDVAPVRERERTAVVAPVMEETSTSSRPICDVAPVRERERTAVVAPVIEETSTSSRERTAVVTPMVEPNISSKERTAISAKDFRKIVHGYLRKFHSSPWLRMGASPHPPCTNSSTSCEDYHGEGKVGSTELSSHFNHMMSALIKEGFVLDACQYCLCHISRTKYPGVEPIRSVVYLILNTDNADVLVSAQLVLKTLLELHPPCAYEKGAYYKEILLDSWIENGKKKSPGIFDDIISKLEEELNRTGEVNTHRPSVSALADTEDTIKWSFMENDFDTVKRCYDDLSVSDRLQRLFIVFSFIVDVMECDLVVWLVKHGSCLDTHSVLIKERMRPLIVSAIWTNAYSSIGSVSGICERLIKLYLKGFSSHQAEVSFKTFHKIFALIIETMNAAERFPNREILEYGQNCENMAKKFLERVASADLFENDLIYMLKSLKPAWLPFYLCDGQIQKQILAKNSASLATMRRYVEDAYNILLQECRSQDLQDNNVLHKPKKQTRSQYKRKSSKGEVKLHIICRRNRVEELKKILNSGMEIDVNAACNDGWTPLHEAVNHGNVECVEELLKFRAPRACENVNLRAISKNGTTPLIDAIENGRVEICRKLLAVGGQELLQDKKDGKSPIEIARIFCPKNEALLQLLESAPSHSNFFSHLSTPEVKKIAAILPVMISSYIEFRHTLDIELNLSSPSRSPTESAHKSNEAVNVDLLEVKKDLVEFRKLRRSIVNLYKNNVNCTLLRNVSALFLFKQKQNMHNQ